VAVGQAEDLTRAREHARAARLLHDRVLQTLEMLSRPRWIADERLRSHVAVEASWLRRFVEHGREESPMGLLDTVHAVCDRHVRSGLSLDVNEATVRAAADGCPMVPAALLTALEGALHEALTNVSKHSGVRHATVSVSATDQAVTVSVLDHGCGFDPARCPEGFGLGDSIRARIREVGGQVRVEAWPGQGTHVELQVPVSGNLSVHAADDVAQLR
jgi:signal transduction histidine kinase